LLEVVEEANPTGEIYLITDNLASHKSPPIREWLSVHPRVEQVFIPKGAAWLKLQEEAWWRMCSAEKPWPGSTLLTTRRSRWLGG
jgi:hypothetical protein